MKFIFRLILSLTFFTMFGLTSHAKISMSMENKDIHKDDQVFYLLHLVDQEIYGSLFETIKDIDLGQNKALLYTRQAFDQNIKEKEEWTAVKDFFTDNEIESILQNCVSQFGGTSENYTVQGLGTFPTCHLKNLGKDSKFFSSLQANVFNKTHYKIQKASDAWFGHVPITAIFEAHFITDYGPMIMKTQNFLFAP